MMGFHSSGRDFGPLIPINPPEPEPIPGLNLDAIPQRLKSFDITHSLADDRPAFVMLADIVSKVLAEDRRVRRMLPPLPAGYEWHGEIQASRDDPESFMRDEEKLRIVYRVREIPDFR